ncbi:hypothetical protein PV325_008510 [Microctonus aethiopoides]|uniref:Protein cueball n=1 Tax=Microctonus aethiopoides TaxID=144406 RepID=A0AA39F8Q5_9HYME|nr:hypothetical protein PV325_008510 [Microctonus aethiopoides]KAK0165037.1 hypothetical protein PV328_003594 [Microctonus aethiopoides]
MILDDTRLFVILIISILMININHVISWDVAVTIGQEIDFFLSDGTLIRNVTNRNATSFSSITYDDASHNVYLGDRRSKNGSIFVYNLQSNKNDMTTLFINENRSHIMGIIYDPVSKSLFWTDDKERAIFKFPVGTNITSVKPEMVLNLTDEIPRGLTIDLCSRHLYWTNTNKSNSSISRSNIDGTNRTIIIDKNLYEPVAVAIDHRSAKLYWLDDVEGVHFKVEKSNLDGTNRERLVYERHQQPVHIAVGRDKVYWTDWTYEGIWCIEKDMTVKNSPRLWKSFENMDSHPTGLVARDNAENVDCIMMTKAAENNNLMNEKKNTDYNRYDALNVNIKENNSTSKLLKLCLNGGYYNEAKKACQCTQRYNGLYCERSLCENYCLHGECKVSSNNEVQCDCAPEYSGIRCEKHICSDYCLNGGNCSVRQGEPFCSCPFSQGRRCEETNDITAICAIVCATQIHQLNVSYINFCSCSERNFTNPEYNTFGYDSWVNLLITIFAIVVGILIIIVIVLSYFVNKYRRRPRVKKRFVVSKAGITPLTSRPQLPDDHCEIMIENCCNMNICETPCFEPKLRSPQLSTKKKEDKNCLLDNMDGNNAC